MEGIALSSVEHPVCEWVTGARKFSLSFRPDVIGRLTIECWMAFKRVPRRGLEIGGVLFGCAECVKDGTRIRIEEFQAVESEHRLGPSFLLSETDLMQLQAAIRQSGHLNGGVDASQAKPLGIFRSHTRSESLELSQPDFEVFDGCLGSEGLIFLVLGPALSKGTIYARVEGALKPVYEFPIASSLSTIMSLRPEAPHPRPDGSSTPRREPREPSAPAPASTSESFDPPETIRLPLPPPAEPLQIQHSISIAQYQLGRQAPLLETEPKTSSGIKGGWLVPAMVGCLVLGAAANSLSDSLHRAIVSEKHSAQFLDLRVEPAGSGLRLVWDPSAYPPGGSPRAILHIQDGNQKSDRDLTAAEFSAGTLAYQPQNRGVTFRLDVYSLEPNASGSVAVMNYGSSPAPASQEAENSVQATPPPAHVAKAISDASILEWSEAPAPTYHSRQARENPGLGSR